MEIQMILTDSGNNDHLVCWIAVALLLTSFSLGDAAIIAACASLVTIGQLVACAVSFALVGSGLLFTVWQMRRS
jgi:hypothetical protein